MLFAFVRVFSVESSKSRIKRTVSNVAVEEPFRNVTSLEQISLESLNLSIMTGDLNLIPCSVSSSILTVIIWPPVPLTAQSASGRYRTGSLCD